MDLIEPHSVPPSMHMWAYGHDEEAAMRRPALHSLTAHTLNAPYAAQLVIPSTPTFFPLNVTAAQDTCHQWRIRQPWLRCWARHARRPIRQAHNQPPLGHTQHRPCAIHIILLHYISLNRRLYITYELTEIGRRSISHRAR